MIALLLAAGAQLAQHLRPVGSLRSSGRAHVPAGELARLHSVALDVAHEEVTAVLALEDAEAEDVVRQHGASSALLDRDVGIVGSFVDPVHGGHGGVGVGVNVVGGGDLQGGEGANVFL